MVPDHDLRHGRADADGDASELSCPEKQGKTKGPRMPVKCPATVFKSVWQTPQNLKSISVSFWTRLRRARVAALTSQSVEVHAEG